MTRLTERVGPHHALRLLAFAELLGAHEAYELGLIHHVCDFAKDLPQRVLDQAGALAHAHPVSLIAALKHARYGAPGRAERIAMERGPFAACWEGEAHHERVQRFLDKDSLVSRAKEE